MTSVFGQFNFEASVFYIPFCWSDHWVLVELHIEEQVIIFYDSLQNVPFEYNARLIEIKSLVNGFILVTV